MMARSFKFFLSLMLFLVVATAVVAVSIPPFTFSSCNCDDDGSDMENMRHYQFLSDFLIALAYFSIPLELLYFISCSEAFPFWWVVAQFGAFIVLCGLTHFVSIWTYGPHSFNVMFAQTILKVLTALVSCATAISLVHMIPMLLRVKVRELFLMNKAEELNREVNIIKKQEETGRHVRMLTQEIRRFIDKHTILSITLEQLGKALHLENCTIWMPDPQGLAMELTHELKRRMILEPVSVPANDVLVKTVQNSTEAVLVPADSLLGRESSHAAAVLGPMVAVRLPLLGSSNFGGSGPRSMDTTYAIMVLGLPKGTSREWGPNELDIVETVADQVAVALSHAAILEESHRIQDQLVEKNSALQQVRKNAEAAILAINQFLAVINQEMRTPLHTIKALASLLQETGLNPEQLAVVETVGKSSDMLSMVINDMRRYTKLEDGSVILDLRPFDLLAFFREAAKFSISTVRSKGLQFSLEILSELPQYVIGDEKRILQVILNLIGFIIRSTAQGSIIMSVSIDTKENFRWDPRNPMWRPSFHDGFLFLRIKIRNDCIGVENWDIRKLLLKFSQMETSSSDNSVDTDLRLAVCKRVIQLMKGHMWVENGESGSGCVVTCVVCLQLPVHSMHHPVAKNIFKEDLKGLKVLVTDDNLISRIVTKQVLENLGCQVTVVESGRQCLATLAQPGSTYKLLLLDLWMPDMDGYEVALRIRKNIHPERRPVVVAFTADTDESSQENCLKAGMDGVVLKPASVVEMSSQLCAILRNARKVEYNIIR